MNAARRKRDPHPLARFVSKFLPFLGGGWPRALAAVAILGLFIGGAVYAWHRWGDRIAQSDEYVVRPENIDVTPPPKWIKTDVKAEVLRDSGLTALSLLDRNLTVRVGEAFAAHHWVERVRRVRKLPGHPPRLTVELDYRRPVAMVEVLLHKQPGLLPVDGSGVLLPPTEFSEDQVREYLRISAPDTTPAGKVGTGWGDPRVHGAARIAALLQDSWKSLTLHRIVAQRGPPDVAAPKPLDAATFEVYTRGGTKILWGAAPGSDSAAEKTLALKKLSRLLAFAQTHDGLDSSKTPKEIDLRPKDAEPRTANRPAPQSP